MVRRLGLLLLWLAPITLGAQEWVTLDQSLGLSYMGSQVSAAGQSSSVAMSRADYQVNVGMPVMAYRLGTLVVGAGLGYLRQDGALGAGGDLGLNTMQVQTSLFPYQPYHLNFSFSRSDSPSLFGEGRQRAESFGASLIYQGRYLRNFRMAYQRGTLSLGGRGGSYASLMATEHQVRGRTELSLAADAHETAMTGGQTWRSVGLNLNTRTPFDGNWTLTNLVQANRVLGFSQMGVSSSMGGSLGPWTSMTQLSGSYLAWDANNTRSGGLSQSLGRSWDRASLFSSLGWFGGSTSGQAMALPSTLSLALGGSYRLTKAWSVMLDVSRAKQSGLPSAQVSLGLGGMKSVHGGFAWGASVPDILRRSLFYWSNLRFQQRIAEDYPPEYLPPELQKLQMQRRMDQEGSAQFSVDAYRVTQDGPGRQSWYRMLGGLSFQSGLSFQTMGDLRLDDGLSRPGYQLRDRQLTFYSAYPLGPVSLRVSLGYSRNEQVQQAEPSGVNGGVTVPGIPLIAADHSSLHYSAAAQGRLYGAPTTVMVLRMKDGTGLRTTTLIANMATAFGRMTASVTLQQGWRSDGVQNRQVVLNLTRSFDTIGLLGLGD